MIYILIIAGICFLFYVCLPLRLYFFNIFQALKYTFVDIYFYFKHKKYNLAPIGFINVYTGLFGRGKTLSAVHFVVDYYNRYNNLPVYDEKRKLWIKQYVNVLSNVELTSIPYQKFVSMQQIVDLAKQVKEYCEKNECRLVTIVLGDEFSTQMNSRNFKTNLPTPVLNSILTMRHFNLGMVTTSQRFFHCDKLFRDVTQNVIECNKIWRLQCQSTYDAWDMEQACTSTLLKPIKRGGFFVTNKDYNNYDTTAVVDNLIKDYEEGVLLNDEQILALKGSSDVNTDGVQHLSRKGKKRRSVPSS